MNPKAPYIEKEASSGNEDGSDLSPVVIGLLVALVLVILIVVIATTVIYICLRNHRKKVVAEIERLKQKQKGSPKSSSDSSRGYSPPKSGRDSSRNSSNSKPSRGSFKPPSNPPSNPPSKPSSNQSNPLSTSSNNQLNGAYNIKNSATIINETPSVSESSYQSKISRQSSFRNDQEEESGEYVKTFGDTPLSLTQSNSNSQFPPVLPPKSSNSSSFGSALDANDTYGNTKDITLHIDEPIYGQLQRF